MYQYLSCRMLIWTANKKNANMDSLPVALRRTKQTRETLLIHMNGNSLQNKVEEVWSLIKESEAQVFFLTETKIDRTYAQSAYSINRNDSKKKEEAV